MRSAIWNIVLILGILCFVGHAALVLFGHTSTLQAESISALGLIFVGVGAAGKRKNRTMEE